MWSSWSHCSVSCGGGSRARTRSCMVSAPQPGSRLCQGPDTQTQPCGQPQCLQLPETCSWGPWGPCSRSCGTGLASRSGSCPCLLAKEDSMCNDTFSHVDTQACYPGPCQGELLACFPSLQIQGISACLCKAISMKCPYIYPTTPCFVPLRVFAICSLCLL